MKKILFTLAILSFVSFGAQAQLRFGLKGGLNISNLSGNHDEALKSATGFFAGPTIEATLPVIGLGVEGSVLYSQKGVKSDADESGKKMGYIDVPISLKYKFLNLPGINKLVNPFIDAGPYASFKISGDLPDFGSAADQVKAKTFGAGLNFGVGAEIFSKVQIRAGYQIGLTDDFGEGDYSFKYHTWQIGASLLF